tara:strand:- start:274 stop:429 length:156 start_codon:yes stop_codon:yes gene_type:complete
MKNNDKKKIYFWFVWFFLVILWNYGFPKAEPFFDILVAVILSLTFILIKKK